MAATKISGFGYAGFSDLEDFWDDLPVSRLKYNALDDFQEVFQKVVFNQMVLIFHSFKGFSDMDLDMQVFQIWKTSGTTYLLAV
ncbi:hypothetical protein F2Q70_00003355 [Brassica cretica]|uniref:Uncharacterized protein n=2 Tax=Brassica cretica TaxID=69181 RepID=A0A8S9IWR6_BRACR|nr:hypothetical protein F2Q68_00021687 [Brassica cretica]KAF2574135.1 hypothetical protein F2Q70_00003355 [Brassica cretica]KAF3494394.1 hypothetical protein DY000_02052030 [Brassica cretica]